MVNLKEAVNMKKSFWLVSALVSVGAIFVLAGMTALALVWPSYRRIFAAELSEAVDRGHEAGAYPVD